MPALLQPGHLDLYVEVLQKYFFLAHIFSGLICSIADLFFSRDRDEWFDVNLFFFLFPQTGTSPHAGSWGPLP